MRYDGIQLGGKFDTAGINLLPEDKSETKNTNPLALLANNIGNFLATGNVNGDATSTNNNSTGASAFNQ